MDRVEIFKGRRLKRGARLVLKNSLHSVYGVMKIAMKEILTDSHEKVNKVCLVIYWKDGIPVACVYRFDLELMAYCKCRHRRKGCATACVNALTIRGKMYAYTTDYVEFWKNQKHKIEIMA